MPKLAQRLTDYEIKRLKPGDKKGLGRGLYILCDGGGAKSWIYRYKRLDGKETSLSMGKYPEVSIKLAEKRAAEANELIEQGIDPSSARKASLASRKGLLANSFEVVAREMIDTHFKYLSPSYKERSTRRLEIYIFPWIGSNPISEITPRDLLETLKRIENAHKSPTVKKTREVVNLVFKHALVTGRIMHNPCEATKGIIKISRPKHMAALTEPQEVGELMRAIDGFKGTYQVACALKIAPMVFVRPFELRTARWRDINLKNAEWSYVVSKTKTDHLVPLSKQAVKILKDLQRFSGDGEFVFPNGRDPKKPMSEAAINAALQRMGYNTQTEITGHGFRAMARTILHERLEFDRDIIEHQLAHSVQDSLGTAYNRTKFIKQRKEMMQVWADYLDEIKIGKY